MTILFVFATFISILGNVNFLDTLGYATTKDATTKTFYQ